jgi:MoaA/NifB/PqqE/SkfB family radical SAM enzyme
MTKENITKFLRCFFNTPSKIPVEAQIEITNKCNFTCPMCPREIMDVPLTNMEFGLFKEVVRKLSGVKDFILTGWGEPLLHPNFFEMVIFVSSVNPDARIRFTTNGSLLNKDIRGNILNSKIEQVSISIDGIDNMSDFSEGHSESKKVIENVKALASERNSNRRPAIVFQSTIHNNNLKGLKELIKFGGKNGIDRMNLVRLDVREQIRNPKSKIRNLKRPSLKEEGRIYSELKRTGRDYGIPVFFINRQGMLLQMAGHFDRLCFRTVDHVYININGDATPCCNLRKMKTGNLTKNNIDEIWHGKIFRKFRANQLKVCKGCDALKRRHHH